MRSVGPVFRPYADSSGTGITIAWKGMARSRSGPIPAEVGGTPEGGIWVCVTIGGQRRSATAANVGGASAVLSSQLMQSLADKWAFQQG